MMPEELTTDSAYVVRILGKTSLITEVVTKIYL